MVSVVGIVVDGVVVVDVLEGAGVVSQSLVVVAGVQDNVVGVVVGQLVVGSLVVRLLVDGVSLTLDLGLESVSVVLVVHHTTGAVGLHQGVVARDVVSVALLLLLLDVSGVRVLHSVGELVLGGAMMLVVVGVLMVSQTVSAVQGRGQLVVGVAVVADDHVSRLVVLLQAEAVVSGEDACAGHGQDTQDGDESEGHCGCLVGWDGRK